MFWRCIHEALEVLHAAIYTRRAPRTRPAHAPRARAPRTRPAHAPRARAPHLGGKYAHLGGEYVHIGGEFYIVPRTGVFTTHTRLNTGLRLQRRPELDVAGSHAAPREEAVPHTEVLHCTQDRGVHNVHKAKHKPTPTEFYIVPRTGVFTTDTRLNSGLRLQRRPELNGDLEREFHQNRAQLDAHPVVGPVSPVALPRSRTA